MNSAILNADVQSFIIKNLNTSPATIALKKTPFTAVSIKELAIQIDCRKRCEKKLPLWFNTSGIYYPEKVNIEQSSSQITAAYKATLLNGPNVVDASGGFGVDAFYFAQQAKAVTHCELDASLSQIAKHNLTLLGCQNIDFYTGDSLQFIKKNNKKIDTLYIDPSRRAAGGKVFKFADCEPNLHQNLDFYLQKANRIVIKAAPMLDIKFGLNELKNVSAIHIVSVKNECKELLYVVDKGFTGVPNLVCALLWPNKPTVLVSAKLDDEKNTPLSYCKIKQYLYEPDAAILKAGLFKTVSKLYDVGKLNQNSHLYTATILIPNFPGRILKIESIMPYSVFEKQNKKHHANVVCRNFNLEPEEIKKKFKIGNSDNAFLYFTTDNVNQKVVILCIK
jgi:16S rRNA G966 N2-methylase RsmD